jgi:hypothetical protein
MIEHRIAFTDSELKATATQDNLGILALNRFLRGLPKEQRGFFKDCRIEAVIPVHMPRGDFKENVHAMNMDKDQLAWLLKTRPEFKACDDTANNTLVTGSKVVSIGVSGVDETAEATKNSTCSEKL